ncbi:MAG: penicillin acylase family protein [Alphaproteobacteria bacterium]
MMPTAGLPIQQPVTIYWNAYKVPFIEAKTDTDAAFALGLTHAHLRLGQMELMRRISQARLSEIAGPIGVVADIEEVLRIIDLGRTSKEVYAAMPADTKAWLDSFVAGLNHYQRTAKTLPHEYTVLGLDREPWEPHEILTIGRLASVDVSWMIWFRLMALRDRPDWPQLWARALEQGTASATSFAWEDDESLNRLAQLLTQNAKWGSNSFAVNASKTSAGSAIIASDPHLGVGLPNLWVLAGVKSPSYHMVGLMVPGIPFVAVGRNQDIAWGGTNLRSASSDLFDVSSVPESEITEREIPIDVRWWFDRSVTARETKYGPILSDAEIFPARDGEVLALKWIGHYPTDELTSMLRVNQASDWPAFRKALEGFSISPQNFIYADVAGNVGQVTATHLPARTTETPDDIVRPLEEAAAWDTILTSRELPSAFNPDVGFVATANNKPADGPTPIGYFFSGDDRILRMRQVLGEAENLTVDDMRELQTDTFMRSAVILRDAMVATLPATVDLDPQAEKALIALRDWDGRYEVDSRGAVAFEAAAALLIPALLSDAEQIAFEVGGAEYADYALMVTQTPPDQISGPLVTALTEAAKVMAEHPTWGDFHTLKVQHNFGAIPLIGGRYQVAEIPWPGSGETLWKADHPLATGPTRTTYGAQSRHVSDMSDLDSNWFVLLGGNDGWINSGSFADQLDLFGRGEMIHVPMRLESVKTAFPFRSVLTP